MAKSDCADVTWNMPTASFRLTTVPPAAVMAATAAEALTPSSATTVYSMAVAAEAVPGVMARNDARAVAVATAPAAKRLLMGGIPSNAAATHKAWGLRTGHPEHVQCLI